MVSIPDIKNMAHNTPSIEVSEDNVSEDEVSEDEVSEGESDDEQAYTHTGVLQFNEEGQYCYIEMDDGTEVRTTPLFEFFNGFIDANTAITRMSDMYTQEDINCFTNLLDLYTRSMISPEEFYDVCKRRFSF